MYVCVLILLFPSDIFFSLGLEKINYKLNKLYYQLLYITYYVLLFDSILDAISSFLLLQPFNILINFVHCLVSQKFLICFLCFAISIFLKKSIFFFPYTDTCICLHFHVCTQIGGYSNFMFCDWE